MRVSAKQIRAARVLLDWNQDRLATASGVNVTTIQSWESGANSPRSSTYDKVTNMLANAGIEFLEGDGVQRRQHKVMTWSGREGFARFRQDVLDISRQGSPDICVSNVDERLFDEWGEGQINEHYRSAIRISAKENPDFRMRILVREGDPYNIASEYAEYRCISDKEFGDFPFYLYGNKTACILFNNNSLDILVIEHPFFTQYYRKIFDESWTGAKQI